MSQRTSCALDHRGCLPLQKILISFGAPISEEQAWALCYSCIQCYQDISVEDRSKCVLVTDLNHVILNKDGFVQSTSFLPENTEGRSRIRGSSEGKVVAELGVVLYRALDFGLNNDEERDLSPSLNHLIDLMTSAECERGETDDEGIERDSGDSEDELDRYTNFGLHDAMELCMSRITKGGSIGSGDQSVQDHYRAVVRALVAEAVDLSFFLQNVATSKRFLTNSSDLLSSEGELQHLQCEDWARMWMQVMRQLRDGVKLKKGSYTLQPLEYSLTPYEMLMEDIRSRRYNLNKVMENGDIPQKVKKDAHSIILDFIRSRPPLKKASERKLLPPPRKVSPPMELLMESIRKDQKKLRHVQTPVRSRPLSRSLSFRPMATCKMNLLLNTVLLVLLVVVPESVLGKMNLLLNTVLLVLLVVVPESVLGRRRLRCQKIDSLGSEEYSASYAVKDGSILALRLVPGYDRHVTHNVNFYFWDHSYIRSPHAYISRIGLFNNWPWSLVSYHQRSEVSQDTELTTSPPMGKWMLMHVNIKEGQAEVVLTAREGETYTVTTTVPDGELYLTAGRYNVLTPAYQVAWGCQVIDYSHNEL